MSAPQDEPKPDDPIQDVPRPEPLKALLHRPVVADRRCPECRRPSAAMILERALALYFRCGGCGHIWSEPERRKRKRLPGEPKP